MDNAAAMSEITAMPRQSQPDARKALLSSLAELARTRRYGEISVGSITRAAKVGRSTFYYHFASKDDVLLENLGPMIDALAAAALPDAPACELDAWIEHIWQHRMRAGPLLNGRFGEKLERQLCQTLGRRLIHEDKAQRAIVAEQIAAASVGLLRAWMSRRVNASPATIAGALRRLAQAAATAPRA